MARTATKHNLIGLKTLVEMQLKDKMRNASSGLKATILKSVTTVIGVVVMTVIMYLLMSVAVKLSLFSIIKIMPVSVIVVVFTIFFIVSTVVNTIMLSNSLYFSSDNQILLTMPIKPNLIFFSKIIVFYVYELYKNLFLMLPLFWAYGIISNYSIVYYFWALLCIVFVSMLPVLIGAFLSIPTMLVTSLLKKNKIVSYILFALVVVAFIALVVFLISLIPENLNIIERWSVWFWKIQDFLENFTVWFYPFTKLTQMVVGGYQNFVYKLFNLETLWIFLGMLLSVGVLILINFLASRPLFFKMASSPLEHNKNNLTKQKLNKKTKNIQSIILKDFKLFIRDKNNLYNLLSVAISLPIITLLFNKIISAMNTRLLGDIMGLGFNLLLIMVAVLSSNVFMASVYSKEANASYLEKTRPIQSIIPPLSKLLFNFVAISISIVISCIIVAFTRSLNALCSVCFIISVLCFYFGHLLWSAELDFMNPQNKQYVNSAVVQNNPNERTSNVLVYLVSLLAFIVFFLLLMENINYAFIKICIIAIAFVSVRAVLFCKRVKYYYNRRAE